jgi:hypothetical protein
MKKVAVLSIAAFYLLLTTGMFVCMVHCGAEALIKPQEMQTVMSMQHGKKDCDCCKKHNGFVVKENIKTGISLNFDQAPILIHHFEIADFLLSKPVYINHTSNWSNAPPGYSGRAISIQNCSLLI